VPNRSLLKAANITRVRYKVGRFPLYSYKKMIFLFLSKEYPMHPSRKVQTKPDRDNGRHRPSSEARTNPSPSGAVGDDNPLLWMFRRKDKEGEGMIGAAAFAAGERLRADLTFAGMLPKVTMDWSGQMRVDRTGEGGRLNPTEAALAARQRVDLALRAVGPEFSGLLFDLCGFCKGLEAIERDRRWPARSGKVVVKLALASLARHYGFDDMAMGRKQGRMQSWAAPGARPTMSAQINPLSRAS
jgi:Domain of unknown function (DUF6456)